MENGLYHFYENFFIFLIALADRKVSDREEDDTTALTVEQMMNAFRFFVTAIGFSCTIFATEIIVHRFKKIRSNRRAAGRRKIQVRCSN